MSEDWITAAEAFKLACEALKWPDEARRAICSRAFAGMIDAKAVRMVVAGKTQDNVLINRAFWWAEGQAALTQNWQAGDFETWIDNKIRMRAFGVSFSSAGIEALVGPALAAHAPALPPSANVGGRPRADWWDDLWAEMCRQLYAGDLKPKTQSDIENAMKDWAAAQGHSVADSTIRPRARKLWTALRTEDRN